LGLSYQVVELTEAIRLNIRWVFHILIQELVECGTCVQHFVRLLNIKSRKL